jgi:hypothetical protein
MTYVFAEFKDRDHDHWVLRELVESLDYLDKLQANNHPYGDLLIAKAAQHGMRATTSAHGHYLYLREKIKWRL